MEFSGHLQVLTMIASYVFLTLESINKVVGEIDKLWAIAN